MNALSMHRAAPMGFERVCRLLAGSERIVRRTAPNRRARAVDPPRDGSRHPSYPRRELATRTLRSILGYPLTERLPRTPGLAYNPHSHRRCQRFSPTAFIRRDSRQFVAVFGVRRINAVR